MLSFNVKSEVLNSTVQLLPNGSFSKLLTEANVVPTPDTRPTELDFLEAFKKEIELLDPDNKLHIIQRHQVYLGSYLVIGPSVRLARHEHSTYQFDVDGSHFKEPRRKKACPGFLRALTYTDATGSIYPVVLGHESREECEASYTDMMEIFFGLFSAENRSKIALASDRDKGLVATLLRLQQLYKFSWVFCNAHLVRNVRAKFPEARELAEELFQYIATAPTVHLSADSTQKCQSILPDLLSYIEDIPKERYIKAWFPKNRLGITSNSVESYWSTLSLAGIREETNVPRLFGKIYTDAIEKLNRKLQDKAGFQDVITDWASKKIALTLEEMKRPNRRLTVLSSTEEWSGDIADFDSRVYACNLQTRQCPCQIRNEHSLPCRHLLALAAKLNMMHAPLALVAPCFWHSSWLATFESARPFKKIGFLLKAENRENSFLAPAYTQRKGRPGKTELNGSHPRKSRSATGSYGKLVGINPETISGERPEVLFASKNKASSSTSATGISFGSPNDLEFGHYIGVDDKWVFPPHLSSDALNSLLPDQ